SYPITVLGTSGTLTHSASASLVVSSLPDFTIAAAPSMQAIQAGAAATYSVNISGQSGYSGAANLTVTGLPSGATATFNPVALTKTGASVLTVNTLGSTPPGTYPLTI